MIRPAKHFNPDDPSPGMYCDVPDAVYRLCPLPSSSPLRKWWHTELHAAASMDGRIKDGDTEAMRLGRADHAYIVEGKDRFHEQFTIYEGGCVGVFKNGKRCGATPCGMGMDGPVCGRHGGKEAPDLGDWLTPEQYHTLVTKAERIHSAKVMRHFRRPGGYEEFTVIWSKHDQLWKGRLDRCVLEPPAMILDLKAMGRGDGFTDAMGVPVTLQKKILNYEYHVQAAMYVDAVQQLTDVEAQFVWVFVEKEEPFDVVPIALDSQSREIGMAIWKQRAEMWQRARRRGSCFGVVDEKYKFNQIKSLPAWELRAWNQFEPQDDEEWC